MVGRFRFKLHLDVMEPDDGLAVAESDAENRPGEGSAGEDGAVVARERPRLASVPSRAEDAVDQLQENEKLIAGMSNSTRPLMAAKLHQVLVSLHKRFCKSVSD